MTTEASITPRPDADARIAAAVLAQLRDKGPAAVTIDSVAGRSGCARTTIYRRFADRSEMLTAALCTLPPSTIPAPSDGTRSERLRAAIESAGAFVFNGIGFGGIAALLTDADPEFTEVFRQILLSHRASLAETLSASGDPEPFSPILTVDALTDAVVGSLVAEYARTGTIADDWPDRLLALLAPVAG